MVQWLFSMKYLDFGSIYLFSQINGMTPFDSIKGFQSGKNGLGAAPAIIYFNAESDKSQIFKDNKDKAAPPLGGGAASPPPGGKLVYISGLIKNQIK
jgi:hypothetical protein